MNCSSYKPVSTYIQAGTIFKSATIKVDLVFNDLKGNISPFLCQWYLRLEVYTKYRGWCISVNYSSSFLQDYWRTMQFNCSQIVIMLSWKQPIRNVEIVILVVPCFEARPKRRLRNSVSSNPGMGWCKQNKQLTPSNGNSWATELTSYSLSVHTGISAQNVVPI